MECGVKVTFHFYLILLPMNNYINVTLNKCHWCSLDVCTLSNGNIATHIQAVYI